MASAKVPMTPKGQQKLRDELKHLKEVEAPQVVRDIGTAREHGDLSENAEYHAQREAMGMLQAKINLIKSQLTRAAIVDTDKVPKDQVALGATVVVKDLDYDDEEEYTFVGAGDEDYDAGKYLITSPIGQGLLGKKIGEKVDIEVPKGTLKYEILDIRYDM